MKCTVRGGVPGRDAAGNVFSDASAADEDDVEIVDKVRVRSTARSIREREPTTLLDEGAGSVATECTDEKDAFLVGLVSGSSVSGDW